MTHPSTSPATPRRSQERTPAERLYRALFGITTPRRASLMTEHGDPKYRDAPKDHVFSAADVAEHLDGKRTWAASLALSNGSALAGVRDYDKMNPAEAEQKLVDALAAAARVGVVAFAIYVAGGPSASGGHVWELFAHPAPIADVRAQLGRLPGAKGEIYPSGNPIRLPGGYHRTKKTRGVLILQDGRRFNLDDPAELGAGLAAVLALPRNKAPAKAPREQAQSSGIAFGEHHKAEDWKGLPSGAQLMSSSRYQALF